MSNNGSKSSDLSYEQLLGEIKDISYVLNGKNKIKIEGNYCVDLILLYQENKGLELTKENLFDKFQDNEGKNYLRLTNYGKKIASSNNMFYDRKMHDVRISKKTIRKFVENANDEVIDNIDDTLKDNTSKIVNKKNSESLRNILEKEFSENAFSDQSLGQLIPIKYNPEFYKCEDFNQFYIPKN